VAVYAELFRDNLRHHPYAHYDALPRELQAIHSEDAALWAANHFSPHNALLVAVGETTLDELLPLAQSAFGAWDGPEVPRPEFFAPASPTLQKTLLVDRPGSSGAELRVATLGPERRDLGWPQMALGTRVLSARLDARVERAQGSTSDARYAGATIEQVAFGPSPIVLGARTDVEEAGLALSNLLVDFRSLGARAPTSRELATAVAQLQARSFLDLDTTAGAAEVVTRFGLLALSEGGEDEYLQGLVRATPREVNAVAARHFQVPRVVVVVGDAARLVTPLSHFGQVHVVDPERDFKLERVVTQDPTAPLVVKPKPPDGL
jgi:predicted Zn-dependent peptidase